MAMEVKESINGDNSEAESPPPVSNNSGFMEGSLRGVAGDVGNNLNMKKKMGRPTKYDSDGNLRVQYMSSPPASGFSISGDFSSTKTPRGRTLASTNWKFFSSGEVFASTAGTDFIPHVVTIHTGEDVAEKLLSIAQKGPRGICILSANGTISNVTIRQPSSSSGLLTYEGRFDILNLTGSFTPSENNGMKSRTGGISISLAGPDGRVVGGGVAGGLLAASPIQVVFGSFMTNSYKVHKRKHHEPRIAPVVNNAPDTVTAVVNNAPDTVTAVVNNAPDTVTEAMPVSQVAPATNITQVPATPFSVYSLGESNNGIINNRENPNSTSTGSADYNNSGATFDPRHYPDINVSISFD